LDNKFFIKSFSWVAIANFITKPLWLILFIYAARVLGVEQFGIYTYAISIVLIFSILFDFGLDYIAVREISKHNEQLNNYFSSVIYVRIIFFLLISAVFITYFLLIGDLTSEVTIAIIITLVYKFTTIVLTYLESLVSAFHDFSSYGKMIIFEKLLNTLLGFIALVLSHNILLFLVFLLGANVVSLVIFIIFLTKKYSLNFFIPQINTVKLLLKEALPLLTMNIFILAYFRIDVVILNWLIDDKVIVGIYGSIHRIVEMYMLIPSILMTTAYPIINKYIENDRDFVDNLLKKIFNILIIITLPLVFFIALNSYKVNYLVFGGQYKEGSKGLIFVIWTIIPLGFNYVLGNILISIKKQNYCAIGVGLGSLVNIVLNLILIPKLSFVGASITAFLTELTIFLIYGYFVNKSFPQIQISKLSIKILLISSINMLAFYLYTVFWGYNFLICSGVFIVLTLLLLIATNILNLRDMRKLLQSIFLG